MMRGGYYVESLTGERHDRVLTESQIATVDGCFDLVGSLQHGVASAKRPNKVETAVHGCNLAFSLDSIMSLPR